MKFLVTGCNGWIGRKIAEYLSSKGHSVIGSDMSLTSDLGSLISDYLQLDITKPIEEVLTSDLGHSISGIDAVIHCAGYAHRPNETAEEQKMFYAVNRDGTKHVLDWCERSGIKRFLYVSSIAFYDWAKAGGSETSRGRRTEVGDQESERDDAVSARNPINHQRSSINGVPEEHPVSLPTHYAKSKYEGEELVRNSSLDWRVVRLATVFGDGDRANFSRMASAMKKHIFPVPGKGGARKSVIPVSLAAELIADFTLLDHPPHRLINLGLPTAPSLKEICDAYHTVCGLPKCPSLPMPIAKTMGLCGDLAAKVLGKFPFTSDTLGKLTTDTVVNVDRMLECFPDRTFGSFEDYLKGCVEWYLGSGASG